MGVGGFLFIPLAAFATWHLLFVAPRPQGFLEWGIRILLDELAIGAAIFFGLGFLWAISGHGGLKKSLDTVAVKLAWIVIPPALIFFVAVSILVAWVMFFGGF